MFLTKASDMNDDDAIIEALDNILGLTSESDWPLIHNTVRQYVAEGKLSKDGESRYKEMVDKKLDDNQGETK